MKVTQPLEPHQGPWYIEPIQGNIEHDVLDNIYSLTARRIHYYINPTAKRSVSWRRIQYFDNDFEESLEKYKNGRHELSSKHFPMVKRINRVIVAFFIVMKLI